MGWNKLEDSTKEETAATFDAFGHKARFLVDENIDPSLVEVLSKLGWNAKWVWDYGLTGQPDENVIAVAWNEKRILLTCDQDFLNDSQFPEHRNPGLVVLPHGPIDGEIFVEAIRVVIGIIGPLGNAYLKTKIDLRTRYRMTINCRNKQSGIVETQLYRFDSNDNIFEWENSA